MSLLSAMLSQLKLLRAPRTPAIKEPVNGLNVWNYAAPSEEEAEEHIEGEIEKRGLALGDLRFIRSTFGVAFQLPTKISFPEAVEALEKAFAKSEFEASGVGPTAYRDKPEGNGEVKPLTMRMYGQTETKLIINDPTTFPYRGVCCAGFNGREPFSHRVFLSLRIDLSSRISVETYSPEATELSLLTADELGLNRAEPHFANESDLPLWKIVSDAHRWRDPSSGVHYLQLTYRKDVVKHWCWLGCDNSLELPGNGDFKTVVLTSRHTFPTVELNNRYVKSRRIFWPTAPITEAREIFRKRSKRTCSVFGCNKAAAREITATSYSCEDSAGSFSRGSIYHACDDPSHAKLILDDNSERGCEIHAFTPETW